VVLEPLHLTNPKELDLATDPYYPAAVAEAIASSLELYAGRDKAFIAVS
jgi:N-acetylmuramoyl-L-alanine amidase